MSPLAGSHITEASASVILCHIGNLVGLGSDKLTPHYQERLDDLGSELSFVSVAENKYFANFWNEHTGPRLTATQIQKLLVIPKGLVTQKDYEKSKPGARIVSPRPLKERHHNGKQVDDLQPKLTVTELQKQFVVPKGFVTQKQYGKKAPGRITNSFTTGSYAGRLVEMMHYHQSEYSIWANAAFREVKILRSTEPTAVIEVMLISRNMRLQWAKCKVIFSNTTKPHFEPTLTKTRSLPADRDPPDNNGRIESMSLEDLGARERPSDRAGTWSEGSTSMDNISVAINNWSASLFRTGPGYLEGMPIKDSNSREGWRVFHKLQSMESDQERTVRRLSHVFNNTHSSKGDDISQEQGQEFSLYGEPAPRNGLFFRSLDMAVDASRFKGLSGSGGAILADDRSDQDMEINRAKNKGTNDAEMQVVNRTVSFASSIDSGSSKSGELQPLVPLNPLRATGRQQQESTTALSMAAEPGQTIDIIFSNLFNHSTLKVADRVEIHEPCRSVTLLGSDTGDCVWIVERYMIG
ncbi:hypothetical protein BGZ96_007910 [Linnemannia gamsii]|uniref:Uncharacterized protein n=1 Tax=Linnemannia gamsii TaxID=64522 RepID=A0ABQ7KEA8_9FUNG|nr:hypothetical protein BGZ96_007910 [Linnemannia gamsii]